jgi:hypothetical protein
VRSCVPPRVILWMCFLLQNTCMLASALSTLSTASSSLCTAAPKVSVICTCHSLIYPCSCRWETCSDAHACAPSSGGLKSTVAVTGLSRAFIFSHSSPSPHPNSGAQINTLRAQPDAQPDANAPDKVRHRAPMPCPLLAPSAAPFRTAAVRAGWVSVDLRGVFSHGHQSCVCACDAM